MLLWISKPLRLTFGRMNFCLFSSLTNIQFAFCIRCGSVLCHFIGSGNLDKLVFDQRLKLLGKTRVCWMSFLPLCLSVPPHDGLLHRGLFPVQLSKWRAAGSILSEGGEGSAGIYTLFPCPRPASWAADLWSHTGPHHTHRGSMLGLILWSWRFEMLNNNF